MNAISLMTHGYLVDDIAATVQALGPIAPDQGQNLLVRALALPLPSTMTEVLGIHQSDVIIRTALVAGIADIRANPWLLDYVFKNLARDSMTAAEYGEFEIAQAKKWFSKTEIPVVMSDRLDSPSFPVITIALQESVESEATLGDVHYIPSEETEGEWPVLAGPLTPLAYNPASGILKFDPKELTEIVLSAGMVVLDGVGRAHEIFDVLDEGTVQLKAGTVADFSKALIKGAKPRFMTEVESLNFRETYAIGCHVAGEPVHLTYLHSIVRFILLRYKEVLLEARGFERSTLTAGPFSRNPAFDNEVIYSRFENITGYVRNYWPKAVSEKIGAVRGAFQVGTNGTTDPAIAGGQEDPIWLAEQDALLVGIKKAE